MRFLVKARLKRGREQALQNASQEGSLGRGSIAGDEYLHNMQCARLDHQGIAQWVETCFCTEPLQEERPYWEAYFDLLRSKTPTTARTAGTKTGPSAGLVRIAIARAGSKSI